MRTDDQRACGRSETARPSSVSQRFEWQTLKSGKKITHRPKTATARIIEKRGARK